MTGRLSMRVWLVVAAVGLMPSATCADSITFAGSTIALKNISIQSLQGGKVIYLDHSGRRQSRAIDDVRCLGFDGLASLDAAESILNKEISDEGLMPLLKAALQAEGEVQRLWVHARLARVHDLRKEYVQSATHAAHVMMISADPYWRVLEPVGDVNEAGFAAVNEAVETLQAARSKVKVTELAASLARMHKKVAPLHERLAREYTGPAIAADSTISGIARSTILGDGLEPPLKKPATQPPSVAAEKKPVAPSLPSKPSPQPPPPPPSPTRQQAPPANVNSQSAPKVEEPTAANHDPRSAAAIDRLLEAREFKKALELCAEIEQQPDGRDLAKFLYQFGMALKGAGRDLDASVMFMRSALLYPDSADAAASLIEAAEIHRVTINDPDAARRLLDRAVELAAALDQPGQGSRARQALQSLPSSSPPTGKEP